MKTLTTLFLLLSLGILSSCSGNDDDDEGGTLPDTLTDDDDATTGNDDDATDDDDDTVPANDDDDVTTSDDDDDDTTVECVMLDIAVPNEGWAHVAVGSEINYSNNPPASGPHYGNWARFEMFDLVVPRGRWVHNLEHGGIIFLYHPDADPDEIEKLKAAYLAIPPDPDCDYRRALLTPDPLLDTDRPFAVVAANRVLDGKCVDADAIAVWAAEHVAKAPENVCGHGTYVP